MNKAIPLMAKKSLPSTDFARFAALPRGEIRDNAIRKFVKGGGIWSYDPVRSHLGEILREQPRFNFFVPDAPWSVLEERIGAKCKKSQIEREQNCLKAKALFDYWRDNAWSSIRHDDMPAGMMNPSQGYTRFWDNRFCVIDETRTFVPFFDFRGPETRLSADAREVVFSVQDWLIRQSIPELEELALAVIRFDGNKNEGFTVVPHFHSGPVRWSPTELTELMFEVYADWVRVAQEFEHASRRTGTGDNGCFDFG